METKKYLNIVIDGYFNENNREHLENYFFRQFKNAEKDFFEASEFFDGCLRIIESWEKYLQQEVFQRKKELRFMLSGAKNGTNQYADMEGKTIEQKRRETIEYCEQELSEISEQNFTVNLGLLTNGNIAYCMRYNEILQIKLAIHKAFQKTKKINIVEALSRQPIANQKSKSKNTIFYLDTEKFEQLPDMKADKQCSNVQYSIKDNDIRYKVYNTGLFYFLTTIDLPGFQGKTFDGSQYEDDFINGYQKGIAYFNENYSIDRNTIYNNPEHYLKELHQLCFHTKIEKSTTKGWINYVKNSYPMMGDNRSIEKFGYYSGLVSMVESLAEKHDLLFKDFDLLCDECKVKYGKDKDQPLTVEVVADSPEVDKDKKTIWFKFGLLLATYKVNEYLNPNKTALKSNYTAPKIAKELGNDSFNKYILATINNYDLNNSNADKNIYNSRAKMLKIIEHCKTNNLDIDRCFIERLPPE